MNHLLVNSLSEWASFWATYLIVGSFLDIKYQTVTKAQTTIEVPYGNLLRVVFQNVIYTFFAQFLMFKMIPKGIFDPSYSIIRFLISAIIAEIIFFYSHRLLHHPRLYKYHKIHHRFIKPCAISALYCHPIEAIFSNQLSVTVGPAITGMRPVEILIWSMLCSINTLKAHSGLRIKFFNSRYHDLHHQERNVNFGFLYFLDILHGTCKWPTYL